MISPSDLFLHPRLVDTFDDPWNKDGYHIGGPLETKLFSFELQDVVASHLQTKRLLGLAQEERLLVIETVKGYPARSLEDGSTQGVQRFRQEFEDARIQEITDVHWSQNGNDAYVLDSVGRQVHVLEFGPHQAVTIRSIQVSVPNGIHLSSSSRLTVEERVSDRPESIDSAAFISAPKSHAVLEVDLAAGECSILAQGNHHSADLPEEQEDGFRNPGRLVFDNETGLLIASCEEGRLYWIERDGRIHRLATVPIGTSDTITLIVYRLNLFADPARGILITGSPVEDKRWGEFPALLLVIDSASYQAFKIPLFEKSKVARRFLEDSVPNHSHALLLANGDLLFTGDDGVVYQLAQDISLLIDPEYRS